MKKFIIALTALFTITISASAMSYEQARNEALFLTDKMAYELNLTDDQYEAAYEVNLDYLMNIDNYDDVYSSYWNRRNTDISYILYDWQYDLYRNASYFYRPLYWGGGYWHFRIYARYPSRNYYYFGRPEFYATYRGGHSWRSNGGRSFYNGRDFGRGGYGMRDGFNRGGYRSGTMNHSYGNNGNFNRGYNNNRGGYNNREYSNNDRGGYSNNRGGYNDQYNNNRSYRESSTRTTVRRGNNDNNNRKSFGNNSNSGRSIFGGSRSTFSRGSSDNNFRSGNSSMPTSRSFSTPSRGNSNFSSGSSNFRSNQSSSRSNSSNSRSSSNDNGGGGHFGGHR